jgi:hypothetical protein
VFIKGFYVLLHKFHEGEAHMDLGYMKENHVCTWVAVGTITYAQVAMEQSTYVRRFLVR